MRLHLEVMKNLTIHSFQNFCYSLIASPIGPFNKFSAVDVMKTVDFQ